MADLNEFCIWVFKILFSLTNASLFYVLLAQRVQPSDNAVLYAPLMVDGVMALSTSKFSEQAEKTQFSFTQLFCMQQLLF